MKKHQTLNPYPFKRLGGYYFCWNGEDIMVIRYKKIKKEVYAQKHGILSWKFLWQWKLDYTKRYRQKKSERTFESIMVTAVDFMKHRKVIAFIAWVMNDDIFKKTTAYYKFTPYYFMENGHSFKYYDSYEYKNMHTLLRVGKDKLGLERLQELYGEGEREQREAYEKQKEQEKVLDRVPKKEGLQ